MDAYRRYGNHFLLATFEKKGQEQVEQMDVANDVCFATSEHLFFERHWVFAHLAEGQKLRVFM